MNLASPPRRGPHRLKDRLKEAASAAILEAAGEVLAARGIDAPMELIAARAGVAVGTLYNHFKDRRALVEALFAHHRGQVARDVEEAAARTEGEPLRDQLTAMIEALMARKARVSLLVRHSERFSIAPRRGEVRARIARLFGPVLERGRRQGELASDPEGLQAVGLQGLLSAYLHLAMDEPERFPPARVAATVVSAFLDGAAAPRPRKARP